MFPIKKRKTEGFAALLSVLIISAVALILAKNSAFIGRVDLDMINNDILSSTAKSNAESCLSESLERIRDDYDFASTSLRLSINDGSCEANTSNAKPVYYLDIEGRVYEYLYKMRARAELVEGEIKIISWEKI